METPMIAEITFLSVVKGKNFMTPHVLGYYGNAKTAVELSQGTGFSHEKIFGVTVVLDGIHDNDKSKCFYSETEAINYIKQLISK
jgi:hypothetical protein